MKREGRPGILVAAFALTLSAAASAQDQAANPKKSFAGQELKRKAFPGADLSGADFRRADLTQVDFIGAKLRNARFQQAVMRHVMLQRADLTGAVLDGADLTLALYDQDTKWPRGVDPEERGCVQDFSNKDLSGSLQG